MNAEAESVVWGILPAGGNSARMQLGTQSKLFLPIGPNRKPLIQVTIEQLVDSGVITGIVIAARECDFDAIKDILTSFPTLQNKLVIGGSHRSASVKHALAAIPQTATHILIHDAARPLVKPEHVRAVVAKAVVSDAAILAIPSVATLKQVDANGIILQTIDRSSIWEAQTPQVFRREQLMRAIEEIIEAVTDEASLFERLGLPVTVVEGSSENIKITSISDVALLEALLLIANR